MIKKVWKKHQFKFLVLIGLIILGLVILFILNKPSSPYVAPQVSKESPIEVLNDLENYLNIKADIRASNYVDWVSAEGTKLPLSGGYFLIGTQNVNGMGYLGSVDVQNIDQNYLNQVKEKFTPFFINSGFSQSSKNTSQIPNELGELSYGFEKTEIYCVVTLSIQTDPYGNFFCGEVDQTQIALQEQFKSLNTDPSAVFRVEKVAGDFARGTLSGMLGYTWMAVKTNNDWKVVIRAHEPPLCSEVDKYQLPKEIYENCYLNDTTLRFPN